MDDKKICFCLCCNDDLYFNEFKYYIGRLKVPAGFKAEICDIRGAVSMASGYNEAMRRSNAKYKVYMHQDVFIVNRNFISDILGIFQDGSIGMIGMVGSRKFDASGVAWFGDRCGSLYTSNIEKTGISVFNEEIEGDYAEVEVIDGLLMATQHDIAWREDLFKDWDFYDISQSFEFRRAGYKVVVPRQEKPWCIHDDGYMNLKNYHKNREIMEKEYRS